MYRDPKQRERTAVAQVGKLLAARADEIGHPRPRLAASLGFLSVLAPLREKILFEKSTASAVRISDRRLEQELTRAYLAYLDVDHRKNRKRRTRNGRL